MQKTLTLILTVLILFSFSKSYSQADAGPDQDICIDHTYMEAVNPAPSSGFWTVIAGTGTFDDVTLFNTSVTGIVKGINVYRWEVGGDYDDVVITNNQVTVNAGIDQIVCQTNTTLVGNNPVAGSGFWIQTSGTGTITTPTFYNSQVTNLSAGVNLFTWTITDGLCSNSDDVQIYYNKISANAGFDQAICESSTTLSAQAPQAGESGTWTVISGSGIFDNPNSYVANVSGLVQGTNSFVWHITDGICNATDTVTITNQIPSIAIVSPDAEICSSTYTLVGNLQGIGESGLWTNEFGAEGVIVSPTINITTVQSIGTGSNTFRWTISNAFCSTYDDIVITNNTFTTDAGLDYSICADTALLTADNPAPGTGIWEVVNSTAIPQFEDAVFYHTMVRNLGSGSNLFKWTATINGCSAWDIVTISNDMPTQADAGPDRTVCDGIVYLNGNNPIVGTVEWSFVFGSGTIQNPENYNSLVTDLNPGINIFGMTISNALCTTYDEVIITYDTIYVSAGLDDSVCSITYETLNGTQPESGETGMWTVLGGSGVFDSPTLYNSGVTALSGGENLLTWTITRGLCSQSDNVSIFNMTPSSASVSNDQEICTDYTVIGSNPPAIGVGSWSVIAGCGDFDNSLANVTTVRNICSDINIYRWTISNGACSNSAEITVTNNTVDAVVGDSIFVCGTNAYLSGNEPESGQTGTWTVTTGTGLILNNTLYNTAVSNLNVGLNKFRWSINKGTCNDYADLAVTNNFYPANASVAGSTVICTDSADLLGNFPIQGCTGHWEVFFGAGDFVDPNNPTTGVHNLDKGQNTLRWFISKAECKNYDDVNITNNQVFANAGEDVLTCGEDANLFGNNPLPGETGLWTLVAGSGTILTPTSNETAITGQSSGVNVFKWTVFGNGCTDSDLVQVNENSFITVAGINQTVCSTDATLTGQTPLPGTGLWTTGSGVTINNPTNFTTSVTGIQDNSVNVFRWTVQKNGCTAWDEVSITNNLIHADAGLDKNICFSNTTLSAVNPTPGTGLWNITSGSGIITTPNYFASSVTNLNAGTISLTWTVTNENCIDADNLVITNNIVLATAGADQQICDNFTELTGAQPAVGAYGIWTTAGGPGIVQTPSAYNSQVIGLQRGVNTLRWTVYQNGCTNGGDLVQIINNTFDADAGPDQTLIPLDTDTYFEAVSNENCIGQWLILAGNGIIQTDDNPTSYVYNIPTGENVFFWNEFNLLTGCTASDIVSIFVANFIADAGEDQIVCVDTALLNADAEPGATSQVWSIVSGSGDFDNVNDPNTAVRNLYKGVNVLRWTVTFNGYSGYDDVLINNNLIFVSAGEDALICDNTHRMNAQQILGADSTYWSPVGIGGGSILNNTAWNTLVTNLEPGVSHFEWYVNNGSCESRDTVEITYNLPPIAQFETDPTEFCAPTFVTINNTSTYYIGQSPPDEFHWLIEDLAVPSTFDVSTDVLHYFTNSAQWDSIYHIRLIAIDYETMCTDTFYSEVTSLAAPLTAFEVLPDAPLRLPNAVFTIQNQSDVNLVSYEWNFGNTDNKYDTEFIGSFDYEYSIEGTYIITLTGIGNGQCDGFYTDTLIVLPACPLSFTEGSIIAEGYAELTVQFYNDIIYADDPSFTKWHFYGPGDIVPSHINRDSITYENDPTYTYTEPGIYHPYITAWNESCGSEFEPYYSRTDTVIVLSSSNITIVNSNFKLYPNPTDGLITISSSGNLTDAFIELKNVAGQNVPFNIVSNSADAFILDLSSIAKGMYFLKITVDEQTRMLRLVKK